MDIKVFDFNFAGETETIAALTEREAHAFAMEKVDCFSEESADEVGVEVTPEQMKSRKVNLLECENGEDKIVTFEEHLSEMLSDGTKFPALFCSSNY